MRAKIEIKNAHIKVHKCCGHLFRHSAKCEKLNIKDEIRRLSDIGEKTVSISKELDISANFVIDVINGFV